jgi:iron(III) transport system permease protein
MSRSFSFFIFFAMSVFFACFFLYPIWSTVQVAFVSTKGGFTLDYVWEVFRNPLYREGLLNSFIMAVWTTLGCLLVSLPLGWVYSRYEFPGKTLLNSLVLMPLILPPFVGAIGIKAMLGQAGAVNSLLMSLGLMDPAHPADWLGQGQMAGIVVMNVLHLYPILYLNIVAALSNLDPAMEEAAANLGCPAWQRFWKITLPLIMPGVFAGGTIVFIWAFTELGVPLVFDYTRVTSVQIFNAIKDLSGNPFPYALVVVMLVFTVLMYALSKLLFERSSSGGGGRATMGRSLVQLHPMIGWLCTLGFASCVGFAVLPHLGVILLSLSTDWYQTVLPEALTLKHYHDALSHDLTLSAVSNSLKYASLATVFDLFLGVAIAYVNVRTNIRGRQILDAMAMLPLAVPGLVLAFGYLAMAREGEMFHWLMLGEDPVILLVIAYSVRRLPYIVRSVTAGLQQVSPTLEEAAQNLGAPPLKTLIKITLPLVAPNLIAGGLLAFSFAMLEVSDSMILAQQAAHFPITKAIYALVSALGNGPYLASALGVWAMIFLGITLLGAGLILGKKLGALFKA